MNQQYPALQALLTALDINLNESHIGLFICNLTSLLPQLRKIDIKREFFTPRCEQELNVLASTFVGPFDPKVKASTLNHLFNLLVNQNISNMAGEVAYLCALFLYSQLNKNLITGHSASPNVKTNRSRMRVFVEKVAKGAVQLEKFSELKGELVDAKVLLANITSNDAVEENRKAAILFGNIYIAIKGDDDFSIVNRTKATTTLGNPNHKRLKKDLNPHPKKPYKCNLGQKGRAKPQPDDGGIGNIIGISSANYITKSTIESSAPVCHEVHQCNNPDFVNLEEAQRYSQSKKGTENAYVQEHSRVLNNKEACVFYADLLCRFKIAETAEQKKSLIGMIFVLLIGLDESWLGDIVLVDELNNYDFLEKRRILISTLGYLQFIQLEQPHAYHPKSQNQPYLKGNTPQLITLPLPISLIPIITEVKGFLDSPHFIIDKAAYQKEFTKVAATFNKRFTNDKLREFTFNLYYLAFGNDEVLATLIKPVSPYMLPSSTYYDHVPVEQLVTTHTSIFTEVFGECAPMVELNSHTFIGSKLCIALPTISEWLAKLVNPLENAKIDCRTLEDLVYAHNIYTLYTTTLLAITTSHRPINGMFEDRNSFFIKNGFILISDKLVGANHDLRMVPLCQIAKKQVKFYLTHLSNMANRIRQFDIEMSGKLTGLIEPNKQQSLPLLLLLSIDKNGGLQTQGVQKSSLENYWSSLKLPTNFYRHLMCSQIRMNNTTRENVNFYMGHFLKGQNIFGLNSPVKSKIILQELSTAIDEITMDLGMVNITGISDIHLDKESRNKLEGIKPVFPANVKLGSEERKIKREKRLNKAKTAVYVYLEDVHPNFFTHPQKKLSENTLNKITEYVLSNAKGLRTPMYGEFNKLIKQRAKLANRTSESIFYTLENYEKSCLTEGFSINAQSYMLLKDEIIALLNDNFIIAECRDKKRIEPFVLVYLLSLTIDLGYTYNPTQFFHLIKNDAIEHNGNIFFESASKTTYPKQYAPNALSLFCIDKLKKQSSKSAPAKKTINKAITKILTTLHKKNNLLPDTIEKFIKIVEVGCIVEQSPMFNEYRKGEILFDVHSSKLKKENN